MAIRAMQNRGRGGSRRRPQGGMHQAALHGTPHRPAVVVLTSATDDEHLVRAMQAGATSYLLKTAPAEHVLAAIRDAAAGTASLSPELLTRLTQALRRDLAIGEQTAKTHVRSILTKLGLQDRVQAAIFALRHQADNLGAPTVTARSPSAFHGTTGTVTRPPSTG